jgi:SAM-dependent methyltransferase
LSTTTGQWGNGGNEEPVRYHQQMDRSNGYEAVSEEFLARCGSGSTRSIAIGVEEVRRWARTLPRGSSVVDLGCGPGFPNTVVLVEEGLHVFGVDAAPSFVAAFQRNLPMHAMQPVLSSFRQRVEWQK